MKLSDETKKRMGEIFGMDYDEFMKMDPNEQTRYIEEKNGCRMGYDARFRIDGVPVERNKTIKEIERNIDKRIAKHKKEREI